MPQVVRAVSQLSRMSRAVASGARAIGMLLSLATAPVIAASPTTGEWRFVALLDGTPIGTHRFVLMPATGEGRDVRVLSSAARFDVRIVGLRVYAYDHTAEERWNGDCLAAIAAVTDDNGKLTRVKGRATRDGFVLDGAEGERDVSPSRRPVEVNSCLMGFAYWNPALARQQRLLDPATGRIESVTIAPLAAAPIEVRGRRVSARGLRISGLAHPIDVWYAGDEWVGLDTMVSGARRLSYRLCHPTGEFTCPPS